MNWGPGSYVLVKLWQGIYIKNHFIKKILKNKTRLCNLMLSQYWWNCWLGLFSQFMCGSVKHKIKCTFALFSKLILLINQICSLLILHQKRLPKEHWCTFLLQNYSVISLQHKWLEIGNWCGISARFLC